MASTTLKSTLIKGLLAGLASAIINSVLFFAFKNLGAINDAVEIMPGEPIGVHNAIISSLLSSLIASLVYYVISIFSREPFRMFQRITWVILPLSFLSPFLVITNVPIGFAISLNIMHIVVAAAILYIMKRKLIFFE
jgi:hypothetical protein